MQWQIDPNHTTITAAVKHMMLTTVRGGFGGATGVIDFDPAKPEAGGIELRIPAKTVNTFDAKLSFDRTQWGLTWNMPVPSGVLVGEKITIEASIAATPKAEAIAA